MSNPVFDKLMNEQQPDPIRAMTQIEGFIWVNVLVRYKLDGTAEIVRSFTSPAKESVVKGLKKDKKPKATKPKLDFKSEGKKETSDLF